MQKTHKQSIKLVLLILLFSSGMYGQQKPIVQLHGIINNQHSKSIPFVHVLNTNSARITVTDDKGVYSLIAKGGDTIKISCIGYKTHYYSIDENLDDFIYTKDFTLETDTIELSEFTVYPWATFQDFKEAFLQLEIFSEEEENAIRNITYLLHNLEERYSIQPDPGMSYRVATNQHYEKHFRYKYQTPANNLLNPFAWAQFFEAIKNGDYIFRQEK